jgi:hypothetical protein
MLSPNKGESKMRTVANLLGLVGVLASFTMACAAPTESEPTSGDETGADEAEVVAAKQQCSAAAYNKAFQSYKVAVDNAKLRNRGAVCDEGTTLYEISANLQAAVTTCAQFKTVVATSKYAQPVRDALKGNLSLAAFDGRLTIKDASGKVTLAGLAASLPGTTVFGPAPGVYGNMSKITFAAGGAGTFSSLEFPQDDGMPVWKDVPARWTVSGTELTVTVGGRATVYKIGLDGDSGYDLLLKPKSGGDDFRTMPSECEA